MTANVPLEIVTRTSANLIVILLQQLETSELVVSAQLILSVSLPFAISPLTSAHQSALTCPQSPPTQTAVLALPTAIAVPTPA